MDNSTEGVIYFSLGTNVKSDRVPPKMRDIFMDTFKELPFNVLWKFDTTDFKYVAKNVIIMKWVPQQDVLSRFYV